ncbi:MAG: hypothetical protein JXM69_14245 [Anaerolineae bacterium]|nr:hypothetical protein [Anaerolineae bacterium]
MIKTKEQVEKQKRPFVPRPSFRQVIDAAIDRLATRAQERQEAREQFENLLPPDFTGQVFLAAVAAGKEVEARLEFVQAELERVTGELKRVRTERFDLCPRLMRPAKRKGDIFGEFTIEPPRPDPNVRLVTAEVIEFGKDKIRPLELYQRRLLAEQSSKQSLLNDLRKVATLASDGAPALIHFLSRFWSRRPEVGMGLLDKLPPAAKLMGERTVFCDKFGNPLPPQALGPDGLPDISL